MKERHLKEKGLKTDSGSLLVPGYQPGNHEDPFYEKDKSVLVTLNQLQTFFTEVFLGTNMNQVLTLLSLDSRGLKKSQQTKKPRCR